MNASRITMASRSYAHITFESFIKSCKKFQLGKIFHAKAIVHGIASHVSMGASLVEMYSQYGSLEDALKVLVKMPERVPVLWNIAISTYFRAGNCTAAEEIFNTMPCCNDITWSAMIAGYSQNGYVFDALHMFKRMRRKMEDSVVSCNVIASVLSACAQLKDVRVGAQVHGFTVKISRFVEDDEFAGTALVNMYARCDCLVLAKLAFDLLEMKSVVAWTSIIANVVRSGDPLFGLELFRKMVLSGTAPNNFTLSTVVSACAQISCLSYGKELHGVVVRRIYEKLDIYVSTSLIDMYSKCGFMLFAYRTFNMNASHLGSWPTPLWNSLISGYVVNECLDDALRMLRSMIKQPNGRVFLNSVTIVTALAICTKLLSLLLGQELHCYAIKNRWDKEIVLGNGLMDMYCKCGKISSAELIFSKMSKKNSISWTTLIDGYGRQGDGHSAISIFESMTRENKIQLDHVTFVALISACSHSGLVEEGIRYFDQMVQDYGIIPTEENYGCLVDLLARAGLIEEVRNMIKCLPIEPKGNVWGAMLGACKIHGHLDGAEYAMKHLQWLKEKGSSFQTLFSNIYAEIGKRESFIKIREEMIEGGTPKRHGYSWLTRKN